MVQGLLKENLLNIIYGNGENNMGIIICPCGKVIENWQKGIYQITHKDKDGKIIFAQCYHGTIVINKLEEEK